MSKRLPHLENVSTLTYFWVIATLFVLLSYLISKYAIYWTLGHRSVEKLFQVFELHSIFYVKMPKTCNYGRQFASENEPQKLSASGSWEEFFV